MERENRFTGERMTNSIVHLKPSALMELYKTGGFNNLYGVLFVRNEHLSRYQFANSTNLVPGQRVVDVACGEGYGCQILSNSQPSLLLGIDIDFHTTQIARSDCVDSTIIAQAQAEVLPLADKLFDTVISFETIEHLERPEEFLDNVARILDVNGTLIISTPNRTVFNPNATLNDKPNNRFHTREYTQEEFETLLGEHFSEVKLYGQEVPKLRQGNRKGRILSVLELVGELTRVKKSTKVKPIEECINPAYFVAVCRNNTLKTPEC
jgi:ubiquinone/menaquinone biosynthesis C-methylase UbiE